MLEPKDIRQEGAVSEAQAHRERVEAVYKERRAPLTFERDRPGFFAQPGYLLLAIILLGPAPTLAFMLALMGIVRNGMEYPKRYGVYFPFYLWASICLALLPTVGLLLSVPVR